MIIFCYVFKPFNLKISLILGFSLFASIKKTIPHCQKLLGAYLKAYFDLKIISQLHVYVCILCMFSIHVFSLCVFYLCIICVYWLYRCIAVSLYRCIVVSLYRLYRCIVVSVYRCIGVSLNRCICVSLYRCIAVSLYRCIGVRCIVVSLYRLKGKNTRLKLQSEQLWVKRFAPGGYLTSSFFGCRSLHIVHGYLRGC